MLLRRTLLALLAVLICYAFAPAQTKRALTFDDVLAVNRASDVQLANDGRRAVFVVTSWDREADRFNSDLWLTMAEGGGPSLRLTFNARRDDHPRWSPDGRRIAFLSEREGASGAQIFLLSAQGGEAMPLTAHKTSVQAFEWSPDGRYLAFIAEEPPPETKNKPSHKAPVVVDEDYRYAQLWLVEVETKQLRQLSKGARHVTALSWSPDGAQLVFTARQTPQLLSNDTTEIYLASCDLQNAPFDVLRARQLTRGNGVETQPRFSPDGRWISYLAHADGDPTVGPERIHLLPANAEESRGEPRVLAQGFSGYIRSYRWLYNSVQLLFLAGVGVNEHIFSVDLNDRPPQALTRGDGVCSSFATSFDGLQIVYTFEHTRLASEVAGLNARTLLPAQLTQLNPQTATLELGDVEAIKWKSNDGTEIEGLLFYPVGYETGKRYPLVTYIHGGPEGAYTKNFNASWSAFPQVYAGAGYAVFMPNFRGSSNYGAQFAQSNTKLAGKVDYEDVLSGVDELIKRGIADENKLAVAGWSYGGYLSAWIIGHTNRFKCAAYGAGMSNAVSYWGTADIIFQRERLHGGVPWESRKLYDEQSPLTYLAQAKTPTLIFHGEKDERIPLAQSQETYRTLKRLGVPVQLVIYPDQGHGLLVPSYQADKMRREFAWIEKYVMGR